MITVFGSINLDLIFPLDHLPTPGETRLAPAARLEPGGKGANQAVAAALDGARVAMAGAVGTDPLAEAALAGLVAAHVDLSRLRRVDATTGCAAICVDPQGRNQIAVASGANAHARANQVEDAHLQPGHTILLQMEIPAEETAILIRRNQGARLILNLAPALPLPPATLRAIDILVVNEPEAAWLATQLGTQPEALHTALGTIVIRTLGAAGAAYATATTAGNIPAHQIQALDTTAAGDCFTGVLAAALDRNLPLPAAITRANAAAALCCTRLGSQRSLPTAAQTDHLLASTRA